MALKTAKMFKDFYISATSDNDGVMFTPLDIVEVKCKNDNFASQIEILNNSDIDLFKYRYITFDNSAIFEITDIIINGKYATLFIDYISNVTLNVYNNNFCVEAVTSRKLQRMGIDLNEFFVIFGKNAKTQWEQKTKITSNNGDCFFALKLRFSEYPKDLTYAMNYVSDGAPLYARTVTVSTDKLNSGGKTYVQNISAIDKNLPTNDISFFTQFDNATVMYLPIPRNSFSVSIETASSTNNISGSVGDFVSALNKLINDLLLSAELTLLSGKSLYGIDFNAYTVAQPLTQKRANAIVSDNGTSGIKITFNATQITSKVSSTNAAFGGCIRFFKQVTKDTSYAFPVFVIDSNVEPQTQGTGTRLVYEGFYDAFLFEKITYRQSTEKNKLFFAMRLFNNIVDLSQSREDYIYIQRRTRGLRVYIDVERNIYTDIDTTFEFAKNAYSNYEAYKKANIDLVQAQERQTLKLQEKQKITAFAVDAAFSFAQNQVDTANAVAGGAQSGGWIGALMAGINSKVNYGLAQGEKAVNLSMEIGNARANLKLAQQQAHERARETILLSSDLAGNTAYTDIYSTGITDANAPDIFFMSFLTATIDEDKITEFSRYIYENQILEKLYDISEFVKPEWQTKLQFYQTKIAKISPKDTNKDLIVYNESEKLSFHTFNVTLLGNAEFSSGRWVYNLKNIGDGIQFSLEVTKDTDVYMIILTDGNSSTTPISFAEYFDATWGGYAFDDIGGVIPTRGSKSQFYDKMPSYVGKFSAYTIDSGSFVQVKLKKQLMPSVDFGEIVLVTTVPNSISL